MKNVLFATTALVAMAGSAMAASHGGMAPVLSFSGEMTAGYNDETEGGLYWAANLDLSASVDLGDSVTASVDATLLDWANGAGATTSNATVEVAYTGSSVSASLKMGDLNDKGASEYFYSDRDGMKVVVENQDATSDVRALIEVGSFGVTAGCQVVAGVCQGINAGAGATLGSIELGFGYDSNELIAPLQRGVVAVSADATFGSFDVGVSYASGDLVAAIPAVVGPPAVPAVPPVLAETSLGVTVGSTFGAVEVGAYYAANSVASDAYGFSVDYSAGAMTVGAFYDNAGTDSYGVDVAYAISDQLKLSAGYLSGSAATIAAPAGLVADHYYVGIDYTVNANVTATVSYSTSDEDLGGPAYKQGITALITASF